MTAIQDCVSKLTHAKTTATTLTPFSQGEALTLEEAYAVQDALLLAAKQQGRALAGYKMGLTSIAKQRNVGVFEPIRGFLLEEMEVGESFSMEGRIHPRVEPEIAVRLSQKVDRVLRPREVASVIDHVGLAIEILDSRYEAFRFKLTDVVADNTSAALFSMGQRRATADDLGQGILLKKNGEILQTATPAAVLGHPYRSVAKLTELLFSTPSSFAHSLEAGTVILTGGMTEAISVTAGDVIEVDSVFDRMKLEVRP